MFVLDEHVTLPVVNDTANNVRTPAVGTSHATDDNASLFVYMLFNNLANRVKYVSHFTQQFPNPSSALTLF